MCDLRKRWCTLQSVAGGDHVGASRRESRTSRSRAARPRPKGGAAPREGSEAHRPSAARTCSSLALATSAAYAWLDRVDRGHDRRPPDDDCGEPSAGPKPAANDGQRTFETCLIEIRVCADRGRSARLPLRTLAQPANRAAGYPSGALSFKRVSIPRTRRELFPYISLQFRTHVHGSVTFSGVRRFS